jgi:hypothetical protein
MGRRLVRKWLFYAAAVYLALATMGMLMFMSLDAPYFEDLAGKMTDKSAFLTAVIQPIECPAIISTTRGNPLSLSHHGLLRMVMPLNSFAARAGLLYAAIRFITKAAVHNIKNTILLKLRI